MPPPFFASIFFGRVESSPASLLRFRILRPFFSQDLQFATPNVLFFSVQREDTRTRQVFRSASDFLFFSPFLLFFPYLSVSC